MRSSEAIPYYLSGRAIIIGFISRIVALLKNIRVVTALFVHR
jgi:hypothetical protein